MSRVHFEKIHFGKIYFEKIHGCVFEEHCCHWGTGGIKNLVAIFRFGRDKIVKFGPDYEIWLILVNLVGIVK